MGKLIIDFFNKEKHGEVYLEECPNGTRYFSKRVNDFPVYHEQFKPLSDKQIDFLENELNQSGANYKFPEWLREFYKITNGCNVFFDSLSIYGEQTPIVLDEKNNLSKSLLNRTDSSWMAPYDMRINDKIDRDSRNRWLVIGSYSFDGTEISWDYKNQRIVAMYKLSELVSMKKWKNLKELDYEKAICAEWDSFDLFFLQETERLRKVASVCEIDDKEFCGWEKTLPIGHKDHEDLE